MPRLTAESRRHQLLSRAVTMCNQYGLANLSADLLAAQCKCSVATVRKHFHNQMVLWNAVLDDKRTYKVVQKEAKNLGLR